MPAFQPDYIVALLAVAGHIGVSGQQSLLCQALHLWISVLQGSTEASKTGQDIFFLV